MPGMTPGICTVSVAAAKAPKDPEFSRKDAEQCL